MPMPSLALTRGSRPRRRGRSMSSISCRTRSGSARRQVDLVQHRDDREVVVERQVDVGERLRLHALRGVDDQDGALARREAPRHLVGEVDVAGRVDQVEDVVEAVLRLVGETHRARLDGDAALALEVHVVEELRRHLALRDRAGALEEPVGERRLPVIDVGDDREVSDAAGVHYPGDLMGVVGPPQVCVRCGGVRGGVWLAGVPRRGASVCASPSPRRTAGSTTSANARGSGGAPTDTPRRGTPASHTPPGPAQRIRAGRHARNGRSVGLASRSYWRLRWRKSTSAGGIGLSTLSSAVTTSTCAKPSAMTTSKPPATSPKVGKAGFGSAGVDDARRRRRSSARCRCRCCCANGDEDAGHRREAVAAAEGDHRDVDVRRPASGSRCRAGRGRPRARTSRG